MKPCLAACVLAGLSFPCLAQATILVGPGGLPQITDAIAIANPGDIVLVAPGTYGWFSLNKALTIRAITPGTVTVLPHLIGLPPFLGYLNGQRVTLAGLNMTGVWCHQGSVALDECTMAGTNPVSCVASTMHLQRCSVTVVTSTPGWNFRALVVSNGHLTAIDSTFDATLGWGMAVELTGNSTFHGSHVDLRTQNEVALRVTAGSQAWLVDATLTTDPLHCPILGTGGHMERTTLVPNCGGLPTGPVLGVSRPAPLQTGTPFVLDFQAQPLETVAVFASTGLGRTLVPGIEQAALLDPTNSWSAFLLTADAAGVAQMTWSVPAQPSLVNTSLWFQGVGFANAPMQASPVAGGLIR